MDDKIPSPEKSRNDSGTLTELLHIRRMTLADVDQVHMIDQLSFSLPWSINSYRFELTENKTTIAQVGELNFKNETAIIVAMSITWLIADEAHIATIAVHPRYRRMGIGKKVLSAALQEAIQGGARIATLEVRQSNLAAMNMYTQFGLKVEGRRPRYYQDTQEDAIIMTVKGLDEAYLSWLREQESTNGRGLEE